MVRLSSLVFLLHLHLPHSPLYSHPWLSEDTNISTLVQAQTKEMFALERDFDAGAFLGFSFSPLSSAASPSSSIFYE